MSRRRPSSRPRGFSLLEVLVAFAIMGLALGVLYQSLGRSVRGVAEAGHHTRAALTAESLLALYESVPPGGVAADGITADGFVWRVLTEPYPLPPESSQIWSLHQIVVVVAWEDRGREHQFRLVSLRPEVETVR